MNLTNIKTLSALAALMFAALLIANFSVPVRAQEIPPTPPDPNTPWNPPNDSGPAGGLMTYTTGGGSSSGFNTWLTDRNMVRRDTFYPQDVIYLWLFTPSSAGNYVVWLYEYYAPVPSIGHWLFWRVGISSGVYIFGSFNPESQQPTGRYAWRLWIVDAFGNFQDIVIWFWYPQPEFPAWGIPIVLVITIVAATAFLRKKHKR